MNIAAIDPARVEVLDLRNRLIGDIEAEQKRSLSLARWHHRFNTGLMVIALLASAVAGIGGLLLGLDEQVVGGLALLPAVIGSVATGLKSQYKSAWYYLKVARLQKLRQQLTYGAPDPITRTFVSDCADAFSETSLKLEDEWIARNGLDFSIFRRKT